VTEVTDGDKPVGPPSRRLFLIGLPTVAIVTLAAGIIVSTLVSRSRETNKPARRLVASGANDYAHRGSGGSFTDSDLTALESALQGDGAELITPLDRGYRPPVPTRSARALASRVPPDASTFALIYKSIADSQFDEGRRLFLRAQTESPGAAWRTALAASLLEVYAGRYDEAIRQARLAQKDRPNDPVILNQEGIALLNAGRVAESADVTLQSVHIQENQNARVTALFADSLDSLATARAVQGRAEEAIFGYRRALEIRYRAVGHNTIGNARTINRLARLYDAQGRFAEAEPLYKEALAVVEKLYGAQSAEAAICLNNMAGHYAEQRQFDRAEPLFKSALAMQIKVIGERNPDTTLTLNNLAGLYADQGKTQEAIQLFERVLRDQLSFGGEKNPDAAQTMDNLANIYARQRRFTDAEALYRRELAVREATLGKSHLDTALTLNNLACLLTRTGRWREADELFQQAVAIHEKSGLSSDPEAANAYTNYAILLRKERRISMARQYETRARQLRVSRAP